MNVYLRSHKFFVEQIFELIFVCLLATKGTARKKKSCELCETKLSRKLFCSQIFLTRLQQSFGEKFRAGSQVLNRTDKFTSLESDVMKV